MNNFVQGCEVVLYVGTALWSIVLCPARYEFGNLPVNLCRSQQKEATEIPKYHAVYASAYAVAWSHSQAFPDLSSQSFAVCINGGRRPGVSSHAP